jgi:UDPglucose 6-dehydrogenase
MAGTRAAVLMTEWDEIVALDWGRAASAMAEPLVIDARNALDPAAMASAGIKYWGVGRGGRPR